MNRKLMSSLLFLCLFVFAKGLEHHCIHDKLEPKLSSSQISSLRSEALSKRQVTPNFNGGLRVHFDTTFFDTDPRICRAEGQVVTLSGDEYTCTQADVLTDSKRKFLNETVLPLAKEFFYKALQVEQLSTLKMSGSCGCGSDASESITVPSRYNAGVTGIDLLVFVEAYSTAPRGSTIAFACSCQSNLSNRPTYGYINIGPNQMNEDPTAFQEQFGVIVHELTHVLGFTYNVFAIKNFLEDVSRPELQENVTIITSAKVKEVAQDHFKCPTLDGIEIENGGKSGTAGSHWERRILYNEYMTGYSSYNPIISKFTLAFLEDTNWYRANYTMAGDLEWGKEEGCDFLMKRCGTRSPPYNCEMSTEMCSSDGRVKGRCNVVEYDGELPTEYQYFPNPALGGSDDLADYCPFIRYTRDWEGDCTVPQYNNDDTQDWYRIQNFGLEHYCPSCRCMNAIQTQIVGPSCHNFTCVNNNLKVKIGRSWYDCNVDDEVIQVTGFNGSFQCPSPANRWCSEVPSYSKWIYLDSFEPDAGRLGDTITVKGSGFDSIDGVTVYLGKDYGCDPESLDVTNDGGQVTVVCKIVNNSRYPITLRGTQDVDVILADGIGRAVTKFSAFRISSAYRNAITKLSLVFVVIASLTFLNY